jgi:subtilisin family serine protease
MDVAKMLTQGVWLGGFLLGSTTAQPAQRFIVKLKDEKIPSGNLAIQESKKQRIEKLKSFSASRLSRKKSVILPRTGFLIAEDLDAYDLQALRENPEVAYVEEDIRWKTQNTGAGAPSSWPTSFEQSPWLRDVLGFIEDTPSPYLDPNFSQARTIVAVVDTGTREEHPFLQGSLERNEAEINGLPGVDDDGNGFIDDTYGANAITRRGSANETYSSHGTHVAGSVKIIRDHAIAEYPEAQQLSILPVRFIGDDGSGSTATAITALEYAASRGAKVINASWGAKGQAAYSRALYETFVNLYEQNDIFFAVAAGNADGMGPNNNDSVPHFPANYNVPSLMSVASATPIYGISGGVFRFLNLTLSDFSNYGRNSVHIAAPGDFLDGRSGTRGVLSAYSGFGPWGNLYVKKQGTSMAAPLIAGVAGVMRAVNPQLSSFEIKELLLRSAVQHSALSQIKNSSMLHARNAIELARNSQSQGVRPRTPSNPVNTGSSEQRSEFERPKGCAGSTSSPSPTNGESGPMGGNSLGLMSLLYAFWVLHRSRKGKAAK